MNETELFSKAKSKLDMLSARFKGQTNRNKPNVNIPTHTAFSPTTEIQDFQIKVSSPEVVEEKLELRAFDEEKTEISIDKNEVDKIISRYSSLREPEPSFSVWRSQKENNHSYFHDNTVLKPGLKPKEKAKVRIKEPPLSKIQSLEKSRISDKPNSQAVSQYYSIPTSQKKHIRSISQFNPPSNSEKENEEEKPKRPIIEPKSLFSSPTKSKTKKKIFEKVDFTPRVHDLSKSMTQHKIRKIPSKNLNFEFENSVSPIIKRGGKLYESSEVSIFFKFVSNGKFQVFIQNKLQWSLKEVYMKLPYFKGLENFSIFPNESTFDIPEFESKKFTLKCKHYSQDFEALAIQLEYRKDHFSTEFLEINFALPISVFYFLEFEPVVFEWFVSIWRSHKRQIASLNFSITSKELFFKLVNFIGFVAQEKVSEKKQKFYALAKISGMDSLYLLKMVLQEHWLSVKAITVNGSFAILKTIINEIKFLV